MGFFGETVRAFVDKGGSVFNSNPSCPSGKSDHNTHLFRGMILGPHGIKNGRRVYPLLCTSRGDKGTYMTCADCGVAYQLTDKKGRPTQ